MKTNKLINNKEEHRYEYIVGNDHPHIAYQIRGKDIYLTHTRIPETLRGKGLGTKLVEDVLEDIEKQGYKLVPLCSFVAGYIKRHPEWTACLKEGIYLG